MRDYLVFAIIAVSAPIGLIRPYYGMLVYMWISYMFPHELAWGFSRDLPGAKLASLSTVAGLLITRAGNTASVFQRENILMIVLWCLFTMSSVFAFNPNLAWSKWMEISKLIIMALVTSTLLRDPKKIRYFFLVIALSLGFYGFKGGLFSLLTGGQERVWGPGTSVIAGNNAIGLALNMALPFLWYLARQETGYLSITLYSMFFLTVPAIMFTYSRASAFTLPIVLFAIMFRGKNRVLVLCTMLIGFILAFPFIPQKFWNRQNTALQYESDRSAMSRIDNWKFCWRLALDRPLTGGGFLFNTDRIFAMYAPEFLYSYGGTTWDTHNIYLAILAAHGFPALFVFLLMIAFCFLSCRRLRRRVGSRADLVWMTSYCYTVEVSLLALLVNGIFVNMEYFELLYDLVAVVASLKVVGGRALSERPNESLRITNDLIPVTG
ncbi:MAG: putative O-glycosylation ligase, exosortase A system-associated [Acidobacteria bacterium]|nr:MAG: putative O-glycosylation ligase, exosortase A system-associated [Acidobacteriota bacterium]